MHELIDIQTIEDLYSSDLEPGQKIKLINRNYASFKIGDLYEIDKFLDTEKTKLKLVGGLPGGWVSIKNVERPVDDTDLRLMDLYELIESHGLGIFVEFGSPDVRILNLLGKPINGTNLALSHKNNRVTINDRDYGFFPVTFLTRAPKRNKHKLSIKFKDSLSDSAKACAGLHLEENTFNRLLKSNVWGKDIDEAFGKKFTEQNLISLLKKGYYMSEDFYVNIRMIDIEFNVEKNEKKLVTNVEDFENQGIDIVWGDSPNLPF
jgi:hypothetical protein